jgi:hypothetical protein
MAADSRETVGVKPIIKNMLANEKVWEEIDSISEQGLPPLDYQVAFTEVFTLKNDALKNTSLQAVYEAAKELVNKRIKKKSIEHRHSTALQIRNGRVKRVELLLTDRSNPHTV